MRLRTMHKRRKRKLNRKKSVEGKITSFLILPDRCEFILGPKEREKPFHQPYMWEEFFPEFSQEEVGRMLLKDFIEQMHHETIDLGDGTYKHRWFPNILDAEVLDEN